MRKYRRITYEDRCQIYALSKRGVSQESIAGVLGVSQSAVSREMCRNRGQRGYQFERELASERVRDKLAALTRYSSGQSCASRVQRHGVTTTGTGYGSRRGHILLVRQ